MSLTLISSSKCHNGEVRRYSHQSAVNNCEMKFHVFVPGCISDRPVPVLYFLSGLTCTDENFITKACAIQGANRENIMLVCPDTSPRGADVPTSTSDSFIGLGAGFYIDATQEPWSKNYQMFSYITSELFNLVSSNFNVDKDRQSIFGHSMGGHGALISAFKKPGQYRSVSALAPICDAPIFPAVTEYLGKDVSKHQEYCAHLLARTYNGPHLDILVDQGTSDDFLPKLFPELLKEACAANTQHITLSHHMREGYPHNYWFIQTFIEDHIAFPCQASQQSSLNAFKQACVWCSSLAGWHPITCIHLYPGHVVD
ncbi:hypothetical protein SAMD00019534_048160, partial [Acytostelium subglobosum LB1]|uniref:hypothetical protein n=1 Tax=Acytostelium subglobosum LB1 TaxID=1410327 RepID=UPI000645058A